MTPLLWIALGFLVVGGMVWCVGHFRGAAKSSISKGPLAALYWIVCVGCYIAIILGQIGLFNPAAVLAGAQTSIESFDPVLRVIVYVIAACVFLCLLPGIFVVSLCGLAVGLAGYALFYYKMLLQTLASISEGGQILAVALGVFPPLLLVWLLFWRFQAKLKALLLWLAMPIYGIFFEWWLPAILTRRREKTLMDNVEDKRAKYEGSLETLQTQFPEVRGVSLSNGYDKWYQGIIQRIIDRDRQKTFAEKIKLLGLTKHFFTEYRAALDAHDEFKRANSIYEAKDEQAELDGLRRKKEKIVLKREITELEKEPVVVPARPVDPRSPTQKIVDALDNLDREEAEQLSKCEGNPDRIERVKRIYESRRMKIMESV